MRQVINLNRNEGAALQWFDEKTRSGMQPVTRREAQHYERLGFSVTEYQYNNMTSYRVSDEDWRSGWRCVRVLREIGV